MFTRLFVFAISITFIISAIVAVFFIDVTGDKIFQTSTQKGFDKDNIATYNYLITKDNWIINNTLDTISDSCNGADITCVIVKVNNYLQTDILLSTDKPDTFNVENTLKNRTGTSLDRAVLFASLLSVVNIDVRLAYIDKKFFTYICGIDKKSLIKQIQDDENSRPLLSKNITLNKNKSYVINIDKNRNKEIIIKATALNYFDLFLFTSMQELKNYLHGKPFEYIKGCGASNVLNIDMHCNITDNSTLAFISKEMNNKIAINLFQASVKLSDIKLAEIDNNICIPVDTSIISADIIYPGVITFDQSLAKVINK